MHDRFTFSYEVMGTLWKVRFFNTLTDEKYAELCKLITEELASFDNLYSRFKPNSLIISLSKQKGTFEVPHDLVAILRIYFEMYVPSGKKFTPCIGALLEDVGYDADYSFLEKIDKRDVPDLLSAVTIIDDTHITLHTPVLLDIGAVGKGYCVDLITKLLRTHGMTRFIVDGSGDIYYETNDEETITAGLEHPGDTSLVIGSLEMKRGAMCSSATNRRAWGKYSHYLDPDTKSSPDELYATWVVAESAAYADALSSVLFFAPPEQFSAISFEYCLMNKESRIKKSPGFLATFF